MNEFEKANTQVISLSNVIERLKKYKNYKEFNFIEKLPFIAEYMLDNEFKQYIKRIYIFGSYVCGKPRKDSDIDFCVIIDDSIADRKNEVYFNIEKRLGDENILPNDLLVYNNKDFEKYYNLRGIENLIFKKGALIYEQRIQ